MREATARELEIYVTEEGRAPFTEWLDSLRDIRGRGKIGTRLDRVRLGNFGDGSRVGEGVGELRVDFGVGYRVYYGTARRKVALCLCAGWNTPGPNGVLQANGTG